MTTLRSYRHNVVLHDCADRVTAPKPRDVDHRWLTLPITSVSGFQFRSNTHFFYEIYVRVCVYIYIYICMYIYVLRIYVCHTSLQALHACIINYSSTQTAEHSCCVPTVRYIYILNPFIFTAQNQLYTLFLYHTTVDVVLIRPQQFDVRHIVSSYSSKFKLHNLLSCVTLKGFRLTVHVNSLCF